MAARTRIEVLIDGQCSRGVLTIAMERYHAVVSKSKKYRFFILSYMKRYNIPIYCLQHQYLTE
jgi:hypothetical protein